MENKYILITVFIVHFFGIRILSAQDYNWLIPSTNAQEEDITVYKEVFLDDTNYYISRDYLFKDYQKHYMRYFMSTAALDYEFRDSLPDGCYVLIALTRKEAKRIPDHVLNRYYVAATGCFENGMKQGKFTFSTTRRPPSDRGAFPEDKPVYNSIEFLNDTVNGNVQEYFDTALYHLAQYQMGVLNGYFIFASSTTTLLKYYQDGIPIKEIVIK